MKVPLDFRPEQRILTVTMFCSHPALMNLLELLLKPRIILLNLSFFQRALRLGKLLLKHRNFPPSPSPMTGLNSTPDHSPVPTVTLKTA
ncbi:MAG: hypothetical protein ACNYZI_04845 [Anaerolineales bacterium]